MGGSDERNNKAVDSSVGGLVWVRRRNGSWWPGRIMAHDEVPGSSVVSPKSGTPIKLLGREDASVDWYNLEKSKRVKAFRCGEYDACIEMAKTATGTTSKKAVKYARREDAILHALEIENAHLAKDHNPELCIENATTSGGDPKTCGNQDVAETEEVLDSAPKLLHSSKPFKKMNNVKASKVQSLSGKRRRTPNDSEDDGTEGIKRMRGLEDIGTGLRSKGKVQVGPLLDTKQENGFINHNGSVSNGILANGSPSTKIKRSPVINVNEYSKRKNRRRPLTKVLESTAMVSVSVACDEVVNAECSSLPGFSESKVSAVINNYSDSIGVSCQNAVSLTENVVEACHNKAKDSEISSISVLVEDDLSNRLFDVPLIGEVKHSEGASTATFISSSPKRELVSELTRQCDQTSPTAATLVSGNFNEVATSASKWQIKGKRNSRQMSKNQEARRIAYAEELNNSLPHCSVSDQNPQDPFSVSNSALYDVKIEVKANYKPRNVPLISLMSRSLNGEAIVGHPVTIEMLEDGSCDSIIGNYSKAFSAPTVDGCVAAQNVKPRSSSTKKSSKRKTHIPPSKSSKSKKSSSLSKKTRCLSALTSHKLTVSKKKQVTKKVEEQVVACIPLKVVFSRINEAAKGSARQVQRAFPAATNT